jgi:hypothetical protein
MKKLIVLGALSLFALSSAAAYACDGMKGQHGDTQTQASKTKAKAKTKKDTGSEGGEATKS